MTGCVGTLTGLSSVIASSFCATRRPAPTSPEQTSEVLYTEQNGRAESITVAKPTR